MEPAGDIAAPGYAQRALARLARALSAPHRAGSVVLTQAIAIGVLAGLTTVLFRWTMGAIGTWRNAVGLHPTLWWHWCILPLICATGGAIAGHLTVYLAPEAKGSGIPQVKHALTHPARPMRRRAIWVKFLATAVAIGGGLSMGREGPTVQIGGGLGEWVSRWWPSSRHQRRKFLAAGAGAGLASAFNAPIAGFVFIIEELLKDFSSQTMGTAILATVTAAVVSRSLAGNVYVFDLPARVAEARELPYYVALGLLAGLAGMVFIQAIVRSLDAYERMSVLPPAWRPAVAGLVTGIAGLFVPAALGGGHELAEMAFHTQLLLVAIPLVFAIKLLLTALAYGSGAPGGIFAPILVLGAVLGSGVGLLADQTTHAGTAAVAGFAFAGMGALFTAVVRAPITGIIIVCELTGNYDNVLALMIACVAANVAAQWLKGISIYDVLLVREGIPTLDGQAHHQLAELSVADAMTRDVETLDAGETLEALAPRFFRLEHGGYPVVESDRLVGIVTRRDVARALANKLSADTPARVLMTPDPVTTAPDETLDLAWYRLTERAIGRLIVVHPAAPTAVAGILTRSDVLQAMRTTETRLLHKDMIYRQRPIQARALSRVGRARWFPDAGEEPASGTGRD